MPWDAWLLISFTILVLLPLAACVAADTGMRSEIEARQRHNGQFITFKGEQIDHGMSLTHPVRHHRDQHPGRSR